MKRKHTTVRKANRTFDKSIVAMTNPHTSYGAMKHQANQSKKRELNQGLTGSQSSSVLALLAGGISGMLQSRRSRKRESQD